MTDQEIIQGLIARDNRVTKEFFFDKCRPLFYSIMTKVFDYEVEDGEMVNELYVYLMENDAIKLRNFEYRSSVYQWLKVLAIRFFIHIRGRMIDDTSQETPYDERQQMVDSGTDMTADGDIERLFDNMPSKRYVYVIRRLILEDWEPDELAKDMNITTANLYNIKRRAMAQLTRAALNDIKNMANKEYISDELLAAYLDGNTTKEETEQVLRALKTDKELQEMLDIALQVEEGSAAVVPVNTAFTEEVLPMLQKAALSNENICAVLCEIYILHRRQLPYDEEWLLNTARRKDWLKPEGTPLYCLGNLLAYSGMFVSRKYNSTIEDIQRAIEKGNDVVVGVDREKLYAEDVDLEDLTNHAVVVTHIEKDIVTVFDPYEEPYISNVPLSDFCNAWKQSHNYMIQVLQSVEEYVPHPIDVDNVPLDGDLEELQEAIAENAHDVWAEARIKEGWSYGKERDDAQKLHPDLIPYTALPDSEKEYDRIMAFNTIKLVKKLGYDIVKRN